MKNNKISCKDFYNLVAYTEILRSCLEDAPVDFLGTGGLGSTPYKDEKEWRIKWENAYSELINLIKTL